MSTRILFNGNIYTLDHHNPRVSSLAITQGRILAAGEDSEIMGAFPGVEEVHDLAGATVIPGLVDSHIHLQHYSLTLQKIDCDNLTKSECLRQVAIQAEQSSHGSWILGHGWNQNNWDDGYGTAKDLDEVAPNNPVLLTAKSLHAAWVNNKALDISGVNENTDSPLDGEIQRENYGQPTGILFEKATDLVTSVIPEPTQEEIISAILESQEELLRMGITGVHDFDRERCFTALQEIQQRDQLKLRVIKSIPLDSLSDAIKLGLRSGFGNDWLMIGGIKIFMDGALGPHTAAMNEPYQDDPENIGMLFLDHKQLFQEGKLAVENGFSLAIHAIGDRANHEAIVALDHIRQFEKAIGNVSRLRHRIEHVQVLNPFDIPRFAELGIIASMQPIHAISDMSMADQYWGKRAAFSYAWKSQLENGSVLAFGSDAPVESPNPFYGIHAAVTRKKLDGTPKSEGWYSEQRLTIEEAVQAYTIGPAYAAGLENKTGKLIPGFYADLIVLEKDIFKCDPNLLREIVPLASMINGEWLSGDL